MQELRQFIRHPSEIPIEVSGEPQAAPSTRHLHNVSFGGLAFDSDVRLEPGSIVEVRIPAVSFTSRGRVSWCRRCEDGGFEVGLQFLDAADAFRARMVEQVCHIEQYRQEVHTLEGRELSGDEAAREWIGKFAATFPNPAAERPQ